MDLLRLANFRALLRSTDNEAADDLLSEALTVGTPDEQASVFDDLLDRKSVRGLGAVIEKFQTLPPEIRDRILGDLRPFEAALRESVRHASRDRRLAATRLLAMAGQGRLAYLLIDNINGNDDPLAKASADALRELTARCRAAADRLRDGADRPRDGDDRPRDEYPHDARPDDLDLHWLRTHRGGLEEAVVRVLSSHRGRSSATLVACGVDLLDSVAGRVLGAFSASVPTSPAAAGPLAGPIARRFQNPPDALTVPAFLLVTSHGGMRQLFAPAIARVEDRDALDALLRRSHWLKDTALAACLHGVVRGTWWDEQPLARDLADRPSRDVIRLAPWVAGAGLHAGAQDERLRDLAAHAGDGGTHPAQGGAAAASGAVDAADRNPILLDPEAPPAGCVASRLLLTHLTSTRRRNAGDWLGLLTRLLSDPDERVARVAARELARRRPPGLESLLLGVAAASPASVRRVIGRAVGTGTFGTFWDRFDRMDAPTRQRAGRAMLKLVPDVPERLRRRVSVGPAVERVKALQVVDELNPAEPTATNPRPDLPLAPAVADTVADTVTRPVARPVTELGRPLDDTFGHALADAVAAQTRHPDARVRSKAVTVLARLRAGAEMADTLRVALDDPDPRVRANAIEAVWTIGDAPNVTRLLAARAADIPRSTSVARTSPKPTTRTPATGPTSIPTRSPTPQPLASTPAGPSARERANAIRVLAAMKAPDAAAYLLAMLRDSRDDHRVSAMWATRQLGWWRLLHEVARLASTDPHPRARRYAGVMLRAVVEQHRARVGPPNVRANGSQPSHGVAA